jgi:hypothetical protein
MIIIVNKLARLVPRRFASAGKEIAKTALTSKKGRQARARHPLFSAGGKI